MVNIKNSTDVVLKCKNCSIDFGKNRGQYNAQVKRGITSFYCSTYCLYESRRRKFKVNGEIHTSESAAILLGVDKSKVANYLRSRNLPFEVALNLKIFTFEAL